MISKRIACVVALLFTTATFAESDSSEHGFTVRLNLGAALPYPFAGAPQDGSSDRYDLALPVTAGLTASYWFEEWFALEASADHLFNSERTLAVVGPRVRTTGGAFSLTAGVQAGVVRITDFGGRPEAIAPIVSPSAGVFWNLDPRFPLAFLYALDVPLTGQGHPVAHRIFWSAGYRFGW